MFGRPKINAMLYPIPPNNNLIFHFAGAAPDYVAAFYAEGSFTSIHIDWGDGTSVDMLPQALDDSAYMEGDSKIITLSPPIEGWGSLTFFVIYGAGTFSGGFINSIPNCSMLNGLTTLIIVNTGYVGTTPDISIFPLLQNVQISNSAFTDYGGGG
jgi:hypothetical protein